MKSYLINLDRANQRLEDMRETFNAIAVDFIRVPAVDAKTLTKADRLKWCNNTQLCDGTICCFLSHRRCWQKLLDSGEDYAAVFEDDLIFSASAKAILSDLSWLPESFDIIKLETYMRDTILGKKSVSKTNGHQLRLLKMDHVGTGGYIISRDCAQKLLEQSNQFYVAVDHFLFRHGKGPFSDMTVFQIYPAICIQKQFIEEDAPPSQISGGLKQKTPIIKKINRELVRPFKQIFYCISAFTMNFFSGEQWGKVPFDK